MSENQGNDCGDRCPAEPDQGDQSSGTQARRLVGEDDVVGTPWQVNPEEGLVGADSLGCVTIDRDPPATGVRNRGGQDPGPRCRDLSADPVAAKLQIGQGVPLDGTDLLGIVTVQFFSDNPVLELIVSQLRRLESQLLRQVTIVVADIQGAVGDVLEE